MQALELSTQNLHNFSTVSLRAALAIQPPRHPPGLRTKPEKRWHHPWSSGLWLLRVLKAPLPQGVAVHLQCGCKISFTWSVVPPSPGDIKSDRMGAVGRLN